MNEYQLYCSEGQKFIFDFSFDNTSETECNDSNSHYVSYKIYRSDHPEEELTWEGCLSTNKGETFYLSYSDNSNLRGYLKVYISSSTTRKYIWADIWYDTDCQKIFEGNIMMIPENIS